MQTVFMPEAFGPEGEVPVVIREMTDQEALEAAIDADLTLAGNQAFGLSQLSWDGVSIFTADVTNDIIEPG
jgi:hypothetical protein